MINTVLNILESEINTLQDQLITIGNIAMADGGNGLGESVILTLINIQKEYSLNDKPNNYFQNGH